ncbi:class I SAM-dependent methyltransferase [Halanaerobiaceae bacterium Z-7014]|uniref:Class I SAM-dependent methyltransferase n=1 Tax=Halonatronomonas betaini TaxID=2778430 RepID=A0A931F933_9FIRM|nr:methyltransferase domain-containing protein [Halonatronomonas betaini]MBF8437143.1 class I SAM-dependent methyltransferase [Halonatronomonas betaini]
MAHIFNPENKDKLISDERRRLFKPERLLTAAGLKEGMSVFDVGCGNGFFALPAAKIVGDNGRVFGFDIYQEMLDSLNSRAEESDINNIKTLKVSEEGANLSEINMLKNKEIDFIIMANILHEVPDINNFLKDYLKFLKTGGRLLVIEWRKKETEEGPGLEHRLSPKEVINLMKEQGLKPIYSRVINNNYYLKISEK